MPLFGKIDRANNSYLGVLPQLNKATTAANQNQLYGNTTADVYFKNTAIGQFGVSAAEQTALRESHTSKPAHAGWVLRKEGRGGRAGRVTYETLVAMSSISGDGTGSEDTFIPDYTIVIKTQPASSNHMTGNAITLSVTAVSAPAGATLTYKWQRDGGPGSQTWVDVPNTGIFSGNVAATLAISNNATMNANNFRVVISTTGANTVNSANARVQTY